VLPAFTDSIQTEMAQQADAAYEERYLDGSTDAAFGRLPEYAHEAYLAGYVAKLKELPKDPTRATDPLHATTTLRLWLHGQPQPL
jgi:hypothetical protein